LYSSSNSETAVSDTVNQPSTLVRPDIRNTPAIDSRAPSASSEWLTRRLTGSMSRAPWVRSEGRVDAGEVELEFMGVSLGSQWMGLELAPVI
jgi:hypothetical protein